jgi:hypothetical protein
MYTPTLYHVTTQENYRGIHYDAAIRPDKAAGPSKSVWLVTQGRLAWALAHVSQRHQTPVNKLIVLRVFVDRQNLIKTPLVGVWRTTEPVKPRGRFFTSFAASFWLEK